MTKAKTIIIATLMFLASTTNFNAKENSHQNPHGGVIQAAGDYFIEMVKADNKCTFYLLDANKTTMPNKNITGNLLIQFSDNTAVTADLSALGSDSFLVINDQINTSTSCIITFKVNGKSLSTAFKYAASPYKLEKPHGHSHGEGGHTH